MRKIKNKFLYADAQYSEDDQQILTATALH